MKNIVLSIVACLVVCQAHAKFKYKIVGKSLTAKQICNSTTGRCWPGNLGQPFDFEEAYSPEVGDNISKMDVALQLIGHVVKEGDSRGSTPTRCEKARSPFTSSDIKPLGSSIGVELDYKKTKKLKLDVNAAIKANLEDIKKAAPNLTLGQIAQIEADLKVEYNKVKDEEITITANYTEWGIIGTSKDDLKLGTRFQECFTNMKDNNLRIITAIGLVYYDFAYKESSLDQLAASVEAKMKAYEIPINIGVSFKQQITISINSNYKAGYSVIAWRTASIDEL